MTRFEKWGVWVSSVVVTLTGVIYMGMKYWLPPINGFSVLHHPLEPLMLKLHIVSAPMLVFAVGAITVRHVWSHLRDRDLRGRISGMTAAINVIPMILTGYLIQVFVGEGARRGVALAHIITGLLYAAGLVLHQVMVHRRTVSAAELIAKGDRRPRPARKTSARRIPQ